MSFVLSTFITALISIITKLVTKDLAEKVLRPVLIFVLEKIVSSSKNTVDDEMVAPIIKALRDTNE